MLNARLANTNLFCIHDVNSIIACMQDNVSSIMAETGNGAVSANQLVSALFEGIGSYLHTAVDDMSE